MKKIEAIIKPFKLDEIKDADIYPDRLQAQAGRFLTGYLSLVKKGCLLVKVNTIL